MRDRADIEADIAHVDAWDRHTRNVARQRLARDARHLLAEIDRLTTALADLGWVETGDTR